MCMHKMFVPHRSSSDASLSVEERADRYVRRLQGFYVHLAVYVGVNAMLVGVNLLTTPGVFWAIWPILGWGVKLGAHAVAVFGWPGPTKWKDRVRRNYIRRHAEPPASPLDEAQAERSGDETERLRRRIEHLEAIVTSADWDLLVDLEKSEAVDDQTAALADEVRPQ